MNRLNSDTCVRVSDDRQEKQCYSIVTMAAFNDTCMYY